MDTLWSHDAYLVAMNNTEDMLIHSETHSDKMWLCIVLFIRNYLIPACLYSGEYYKFDLSAQSDSEVI